jgi:hypothetical protein
MAISPWGLPRLDHSLIRIVPALFQVEKQKIAAFGSSYMGIPVGAAEGCDLLILMFAVIRR